MLWFKAKPPRPVVLKTALVVVAKLGAVMTVGLERILARCGVGFISAYALASPQNRHNFAVLQNPTQPRGLIHRSALIPAAARLPIAARDYAID